MRNRKKYRFRPKKPFIKFQCDWGVYPEGKHGNTSVCYCTDEKRARMISMALNRFLNSPEGKKWLKKNMT